MQNEQPQSKLEVLMFHELTIELEKIKVGRQKELQYDFRRLILPKNLHLQRNKLWCIRYRGHLQVPSSSSQRSMVPLPSPTTHYVHISYFDLNEERPFETIVNIIKEKEFCVHWIRDLMLLRVNQTKFVWFDLTGGKFMETESSIPLRKWKKLSSFVTESYSTRKIEHAVDNTLSLTALTKTGKLHHIPLREPFKLSKIAWNYVLNLDLVSHVPKSNWPCSPVFEWVIGQKYTQSCAPGSIVADDY
ncbi:hypothetical protein M3Y95_01066200 [Aphelenchoides besseyi]|nr:hypothetical protein M3Y95_01066200 [Aphelenchoides besseyi]